MSLSTKSLFITINYILQIVIVTFKNNIELILCKIMSENKPQTLVKSIHTLDWMVLFGIGIVCKGETTLMQTKSRFSPDNCPLINEIALKKKKEKKRTFICLKI